MDQVVPQCARVGGLNNELIVATGGTGIQWRALTPMAFLRIIRRARSSALQLSDATQNKAEIQHEESISLVEEHDDHPAAGIGCHVCVSQFVCA